uniref:Cytochrome P450 family 71 subfamily FB polypeptide 1 n=1 Tax=Gloriosa superba TaxID=41220 RepID=A0A7D5Q3W9_GLOSU|nr:cytochrome P450 family 71 subfamily FB polypeptide 1 [Gloriosa superba]
MDLPLALQLLALFFPALLLLIFKRISSPKKLLPPSPPRLPFLGNFHQIGHLPHRSFHDLAMKYGPIISLKLGTVPTILISSGAGVEEICKIQDLIFSTRPQLEIAKRVFYNCRDIAFSPPTEYWRQVRKASILHLLGTKKVQSVRSVREEEVATLVDYIARNSDGTKPVNLSKLLNYHTCYLLSRLTIRLKYSDYGDDGSSPGVKFCDLVRELGFQFGGFYIRDYFPYLGWWSKLSGADAKVHGLFTAWDAFLEEVVDRHAVPPSAGEEEDLVDVLLSLHKEQQISRDDIKAILLDVFSAGTGSSFIAIEWTMAELMRNPDYMKRVQQEIRELAAGREGMITDDDVGKMPFLKALIKETMRLHPPAPIVMPREATEDATVLGYHVPAGTRVVINAWSVGRNPQDWEDPEEYKPERFLGSTVDFKGHDFHLIPFGAGRRICPGMHYSISNIGLALANLLYRFDWKLPDAKPKMDTELMEFPAPSLGTPLETNLMLIATPHK